MQMASVAYGQPKHSRFGDLAKLSASELGDTTLGYLATRKNFVPVAVDAL